MLLNIIIEKDQDGYFARILELEGCVSQGNTYEETLANIKEAGELYLESLANEEKRIIENKTTSIIPMVLANACKRSGKAFIAK
ncbi:TPA: type II toxin-antitoxin system HicB family antitoxin [Campylobacter jejuni]|uniref:Type II toxin-antitoxin system HicB family antitoxin n=10 Tax=Campylobacter TaxID=194 RepID=A0A5T1CA24_CAMJU|nr:MULTISPECIES: type II toxin-antitoxin system HicB family antitoxin [Campylobacter]HEE9604919.1 type II toxin-antitoxin system HicB family antitoxin [Campylobacter jejuni subsp. jejuni]EAH7205155.1 type II toxin-antitoxin system HicB family antitoxin [Campylobacter jejuni]EAI4538036.1 type II toxin-antitoxin system HicB family antitoxin [Campylobacter jejuni]EAI4716053.1 type II toxin-antitoxin system HicB family antitoxin [Campylobacter jejuni]EAI9147738.1 type II toxin-antitoxin system Hic